MEKWAKNLIVQLVFLLFSSANLHAQDIAEIFAKGEEAFSQGKYLLAEKKLWSGA